MAIYTRLLLTSSYSLKSRFQTLLVPFRDRLIISGFSANQITVLTTCLCVAYSILIAWSATTKVALVILPLFLLIRMALNALDGMIASHTQSQSKIGAVLNEVGDVLSDLCLFGAFIFLIPAPVEIWLLLIALCCLIEFVSIAVARVTGLRPNHGPFAKSDRAIFLGVFALVILGNPESTGSVYVLTGVGILLSLLTIWNRYRTLSGAD